MKQEVLEETARNNGFFIVHEEKLKEDGTLIIVPCKTWVQNVFTLSELFDNLKSEHVRILYRRIPVSAEQAPLAIIDDYLKQMREVGHEMDVVFSCGMGVGRTTCSMIIGLLFRACDQITKRPSDASSSLLSVVSVLENAGFPSFPASFLLENPLAIDKLLMASEGKYHLIAEMVRVLDNGTTSKSQLDFACDLCGAVQNIRTGILLSRLEYAKKMGLFGRESNEPLKSLKQGIVLLERYMSLLVLASYLSTKSANSFSDWLSERNEIEGMFTFVKRKSPSLYLFRPLDEPLLFLSKSETPRPFSMGISDGKKTNLCGINIDFHTLSQPEIDKIIASRSGVVLTSNTILKVDLWKQNLLLANACQLPNFRKMNAFVKENMEYFTRGSCLQVFGLGQPTKQGIQLALDKICTNALSLAKDSELMPRIVWVNLREEPLVYISDVPFVLRDIYSTLRNIKSYAGISWNRLEAMEERLKMDVIAEAEEKRKITIHVEIEADLNGGTVSGPVCTVREIFDQVTRI